LVSQYIICVQIKQLRLIAQQQPLGVTLPAEGLGAHQKEMQYAIPILLEPLAEECLPVWDCQVSSHPALLDISTASQDISKSKGLFDEPEVAVTSSCII
jgi:hypothetical protein